MLRKLGGPWEIGQVLLELGMRALDEGKLEQAAAYFEENLACWAQLDDSHSIHDTIWLLGRVALAGGDIAGAAARFGASLAVCSEKWMTWRISECLEGVAIVQAVTDASGPAQRLLSAARLLGAAADLREKLSIPLPPRERPSLERAETAARAGLGDDGYAAAWATGRSMTLEQAVEEARSVTVPPTSALPAEEVVRTASSATTTPLPLSPREQEVAGLVAEGLSNPQIAARLGLSDRTVDAHLRNIMGKLGVASRVQVAAWSVRHGADVAPAP